MAINCSFILKPYERQNYIEHRSDDGIHWNAKAHRWLTNIILTHIAIELGIGIPTFVQGKKGDKKTYFKPTIDSNGDTNTVDTGIPQEKVIQKVLIYES